VIEANRAQHGTCIRNPLPLPFGEDRRADLAHQQLCGDIKMRPVREFTLNLRPRAFGVGIGGWSHCFAALKPMLRSEATSKTARVALPKRILTPNQCPGELKDVAAAQDCGAT